MAKEEKSINPKLRDIPPTMGSERAKARKDGAQLDALADPEQMLLVQIVKAATGSRSAAFTMQLRRLLENLEMFGLHEEVKPSKASMLLIIGNVVGQEVQKYSEYPLVYTFNFYKAHIGVLNNG